MNWKHLASAGLLCLLCACSKEKDKTLEPFTFAGIVAEDNGTHLSGVHISVTASDYSPITGTNNRLPAGETSTDAAGRYAVIPYAYKGITFFELKLEKDGYYDKIVTINADLARSAPQNVYNSDIEMSRR
jgi:hypothetical protein